MGKIISFSLPDSLSDWLDEEGAKEDRSRASVIRKAIVEYRSRQMPKVEPTESEIRAHDRGLAEYRRGKFRTLELTSNNEMDVDHPRKRRRAA